MSKLQELEDKRQGVFGMMAGSTNPLTGKLITAEKETLRLIELVNDYGYVIEQLKAAEAELSRLKAQQNHGVHSWIDVKEIPDSAMTASYDPGAGPIICAVAEVDKELQADGYPALCWAYLDVVPGMMIDRATNSNITSHVVSWLPVERVAK